MKILHVIDLFDPQFERDQDIIIRKLAERGHNVTVLTSTFTCNRSYRSNASDMNSLYSSVKVCRQPGLKIKIPSFRQLILFLPSIEVFGASYDVVHVYTLFTYSSLIMPIFKLLRRECKTVLRTELGPIPSEGTINYTYFKIKRRRVYKGYLHLINKFTDAFYVYTLREREALKSFGISEDKIWVIPLGVDYKKFSNVRRMSNSRITIGYLGRLSPDKGVHRLIKPLTKLLRQGDDIDTVFAGPKSDTEYANRVLKALSGLRNFKYLGVLRSPSLLFSLTDIIVVPTLTETGAITVLQAMASGKAVVASNIYPVDEYIHHGITGFLCENNQDFYRNLKYLTDNPEIIYEVGRKARQAAKEYDCNKMVRKIENMYSS